MYQYSNSLIRQFPSSVTGNAAVGVQATVYVGETGALASLFESNGTTLKANPVTTDDKGFYSFSVADGDYRIVFSSSQFATLRISVLDGAAIREEFDDLVASNAAFRIAQQAAYDSFVLSQGWDQVGTFAAGFTFTSPNQVGQDSSGNWWRWNGAFPKVVTAGTLPSSDSNYKLVGDGVLRSDLAAAASSVLIAGVTAAQVAEAADIAIGNFVTPEQFFTGDVNNPNADWLSAVQDALATGRRVLLSRFYGLSVQLNIPANRLVSGLSRSSTGFRRLSLLPTDNGGAVVAFTGDNVVLSNFKIDGGNLGSAPSNRLNGLIPASPAKNFNISKVDVYNCTGYGHYVAGTESAADVTGVYFDCYSENNQVLYEQIGALDVALYRCKGLGVSGRTTDIFHPYAGSKRVVYDGCHATGVAGGGVTMTATNGYPLGPFYFINSSVKLTGSNSAIVTSVVSGAQTTVECYFHGGEYTSTLGQSASLAAKGTFKAFGTKFDGVGGFNCPAFSQAEANIELHGCDVSAIFESAGSQINALITNGCNPRITGGSITAINTLTGGSASVVGQATVSAETLLTPVSGASKPAFIAEIAGAIDFQVDTTSTGFANILLPVNTTRSKIVPSLSISTDTDAYSANADSLTWYFVTPNTVRVRYVGNPVGTRVLHYRIGVLP